MASIGGWRGRPMATGVHHLVATRELTAAMRQIRAATGDTMGLSVGMLNDTLARLYPDIQDDPAQPGGRYSAPHKVNESYLSKLERGTNAMLPVPAWLRARGMDERTLEAQGSRVRPWLVSAYDVAFAADGFLIDMYPWAMALLADHQHDPPRITRDLPGDVPAGGEDAYFRQGFQDTSEQVRDILRSHAQVLRERRTRVVDESLWSPDPHDQLADTDDDLDEVNPEGVLVPPGDVRVARWRMHNVGPVPWRNRWLYRIWRPGTGLVTPMFVPLPDTEPGGTADIVCPFRVPDTPGTYRMCLKSAWPNGVYCYPHAMPGLICTVTVPPADLADCLEPWDHR